MCGRFALDFSDKFYKRFHIETPIADLQSAPSLQPNFNVAPSNIAPIIINDGTKNLLKFMRWGLVPAWAKDESVGYKMINARRETIAEKTSFKKLLHSKRCLVPATGFYEWKRSEKTKTPYFIHPINDEFIAFAGLYEIWERDTKHMESFTIITTDANAFMTHVHTRMPVMLDQNEEPIWLDPSINDNALLDDILHSDYAEKLEMYPISTNVNSPRNNTRELLKPQGKAVTS